MSWDGGGVGPGDIQGDGTVAGVDWSGGGHHSGNYLSKSNFGGNVGNFGPGEGPGYNELSAAGFDTEIAVAMGKLSRQEIGKMGGPVARIAARNIPAHRPSREALYDRARVQLGLTEPDYMAPTPEFPAAPETVSLPSPPVEQSVFVDWEQIAEISKEAPFNPGPTEAEALNLAVEPAIDIDWAQINALSATQPDFASKDHGESRSLSVPDHLVDWQEAVEEAEGGFIGTHSSWVPGFRENVTLDATGNPTTNISFTPDALAADVVGQVAGFAIGGFPGYLAGRAAGHLAEAIMQPDYSLADAVAGFFGPFSDLAGAAAAEIAPPGPNSDSGDAIFGFGGTSAPETGFESLSGFEGLVSDFADLSSEGSVSAIGDAPGAFDLSDDVRAISAPAQPVKSGSGAMAVLGLAAAIAILS